MNRCPLTYESCGEKQYSDNGLKKLSSKLTELKPLPYSAEEQRYESIARAAKMSIQGVQAKLSAVLDIKKSCFQIVDTGGRFIIKPQSDIYKEMPENEDLTMRLASLAGLDVPFHGMVYSKDNSLSYFIKRFDRLPKKKKLAVEDFAQLSNNTRDTKYSSSMEQAAKVIEEFCTFPAIEKMKLFRLTVFNYLTGNEDMHLKNFSLITQNNIIKLSPCYDLLNTFIATPGATEEIALPINGKKRKLTRYDLTGYYAAERLKLNENIINDILTDIKAAVPKWLALIDISFLSKEMKEKYKMYVTGKCEILGI